MVRSDEPDDQDTDDLDSQDGEQLEDTPPVRNRRRAPAPQGSSWLKILLVVVALSGLGLVVCCGGAFWYFKQAINFSDDPVKAAALQQEIVDIQLLPTLKPQGSMSMNFGVFKMKMVVYKSNGFTNMMLMEMEMEGQTEEAMQQGFRQQGQQQQQGDHFQEESSETKKVTISGAEREFRFAKGKIVTANEPGTPARQVNGMFPSKKGMGFLMLTVEEETYDEAATIQMLESIQK